MMSRGPKFSLDRQGVFSNQNTYVIDSDDLFLVGLLNSRAVWFFLGGVADALRGGVWRLTLYSSFVAQVPVPDVTAEQRRTIEQAVDGCLTHAGRRHDAQRRVVRRLHQEAGRKLPTKLQRFWTLEPGPRLNALGRLLGRKLGLAERDEWDEYMEHAAEAIRGASVAIATQESVIDGVIFDAFGLDQGARALLSGTIGPLPPG